MHRTRSRCPSLLLLAGFLVAALPGCDLTVATLPMPTDEENPAGEDETADEGNTGDEGNTAEEDNTAGEDDTDAEDDTVTPLPAADPSGSGVFDFTVTTAVAAGLDSTVYLPVGAGPFPIIVLTHGFQLSPDEYVSYGEHLASWGYVTVLPQFPGNLFSSPTHTELKNSLADLLDWLESSPSALGGIENPSQLGLAGHSLGGKVALLLATEDARPDAVFAIDPVDSGPPNGGDATDYPSVAPELMGNIDVPVVLLGELQNSVSGGFGPACAPAGENFQSFYGAATSPAMEVEVVGASHMSFLDNPSCLFCLVCPAGTDDHLVTKALTRELMTAFFEAELGEEDWAGAWLGGTELDGLETSGLIAAQSKNGF